MADIFNEIDEDLRRERLKRVWDRYGIFVIGMAVAVVVGVGGWRFYEYQQEEAAKAAGDTYYAALKAGVDGDPKGSIAALEKIAATGPAGYAVVARLRAAGLTVESDPQGAIKAFDAAASAAGTPRVLADLARLQAAYLAIDFEDVKAIEARLAMYLTPVSPFRHSAREMVAIATMKAGDMKAAATRLDELLRDAEVPQGIAARADLLMDIARAAGGTADAAGKVN